MCPQLYGTQIYIFMRPQLYDIQHIYLCVHNFMAPKFIYFCVHNFMTVLHCCRNGWDKLSQWDARCILHSILIWHAVLLFNCDWLFSFSIQNLALYWQNSPKPCQLSPFVYMSIVGSLTYLSWLCWPETKVIPWLQRRASHWLKYCLPLSWSSSELQFLTAPWCRTRSCPPADGPRTWTYPPPWWWCNPEVQPLL